VIAVTGLEQPPMSIEPGAAQARRRCGYTL
jgi:hypothetical protein